MKQNLFVYNIIYNFLKIIMSYLDFKFLKKERRKRLCSFLDRAMENRGCAAFTKFGKTRW